MSIGRNLDMSKKAIKESIAHWYRISACKTPKELEIEGFESEACPLCQEFDVRMFVPSSGLNGTYLNPIQSCLDSDNNKCPVAKKTGKDDCYGTPYYAALDSLDRWMETGDWYNTDQDNVEAEIRFLESLLDD